MEDLPQEIIGEIIIRVDPASLMSCSLVSKQFWRITQQVTPPVKSREEFESACLEGNELKVNKSTFQPEWYFRGLLRRVAENGWLHCFRQLVQHAQKSDLEYAFDGMKSLPILKFMAEEYPGECNWDAILMNGCAAGSLEVIEYAIAQGASDWNWGLRGACYSNRREMIDYMIQKGADSCNDAFIGACRGGHLELVQRFSAGGQIMRGVNECWKNQHLDLCRWIIHNLIDDLPKLMSFVRRLQHGAALTEFIQQSLL